MRRGSKIYYFYSLLFLTRSQRENKINAKEISSIWFCAADVLQDHKQEHALEMNEVDGWMDVDGRDARNK